MTTYQQIRITLDNFEIIFIGALFGPGTAVLTVMPGIRPRWAPGKVQGAWIATGA